MKVADIGLLTERLRMQRGKAKKLSITSNTKDFDPKRPDDYFFIYVFTYDYNGGTFTHEQIIASYKKDISMEDEIDDMISQHKMDKNNYRFIKKGKNAVWVGFHLEEPTFKGDEDEDGPYEWVEGQGEGVVISAKQLSDQAVQNIAAKLEDEMDADAASYIEHAREEARDAAEYAKDPYGYYGLKRSDFM